MRLGQPEQRGEAAESGDDADNLATSSGAPSRGDQVHAQDADEGAEQHPGGDQHHRTKANSGEAPVRAASIRRNAPLRMASPMVRYICTIFHQAGRAKSLRDDVVPAQQPIAGLDLPAVAVGGDVPTGGEFFGVLSMAPTLPVKP